MAVGTLEEIIDENHAIVSTSVGSEYYVVIMSFVDKDLLEPGCTVLLNHKVCLSVTDTVMIKMNNKFTHSCKLTNTLFPVLYIFC